MQRRLKLSVNIANHPDIFTRHIWIHAETDIKNFLMDTPLPEIKTREDDMLAAEYTRRQMRKFINP
jgi:hypothetical protein